MARYADDFGRRRMGMHDFSESGRGYGADYTYGDRGEPTWRSGFRGGRRGWEQGGLTGGMRSDAYGTQWDRFPGEEGWLGEGYAGYPGGDVPRGARGYGGEFRGGAYGAAYGGQGWGGGYGTDYRGGLGYADYETERMGRESAWGDVGLRGRHSDADRVRARDIMTDDPECVTADTTVADVAKKMKELDVGIIPVVDNLENRRLRGVVTDRDLAIRVLAAGKDGKAKVGDFMTEQVATVNQNDSVREIFNVMKREQVRRVPVTDREGRLVGIVAQADLAVSYAGLDLQRETEVEEVIERISEPARPRSR